MSMKTSGLQTPILVRHNRELNPESGLHDGPDLGGFALVAGAHRLEAARELRWPRIEAFVLDELTADEVRLIELDENLMRAELTAFDRARSLARRKELYERIHPETRQGGDRRSQEYLDSTNPQTLQPDLQTPGRAPSFVDDTATSTPWSPRTIQRAVRIAANIVPELQEALVATPIAQREGDPLPARRHARGRSNSGAGTHPRNRNASTKAFRRPFRHTSACRVLPPNSIA